MGFNIRASIRADADTLFMADHLLRLNPSLDIGTQAWSSDGQGEVV